MAESSREEIVLKVIGRIQKIKLYNGHSISKMDGERNDAINFSEGAGELTAYLDQTVYDGVDLASEIQDKLNDAGALTYSVSYSNTTRKLTIAATESFELLFGTGTNASISPAEVMGFNQADTGSASSHVSDSTSVGFHNSIIEVGRKLKEYGDCFGHPAAFITSGDADNDPYTHDQQTVHEKTMRILIDAYIEFEGDNKDRNLNRLIADITKAVLYDPTLDGEVHIIVPQSESTDLGIIDDYGMLSIIFEATYDWSVLNP